MGLLELIEQHRAAVRYDLLRHGFRLEDVGTERLWWPDVLALISEQTPKESAVYRALHPNTYDEDKLVARVEMVSVMLVRFMMMHGNQTEVDSDKMPTAWADLWQVEAKPPNLLSIEEIDKRMGWAGLDMTSEQVLLTTQEIDKRMGWSEWPEP